MRISEGPNDDTVLVGRRFHGGRDTLMGSRSADCAFIVELWPDASLETLTSFSSSICLDSSFLYSHSAVCSSSPKSSKSSRGFVKRPGAAFLTAYGFVDLSLPEPFMVPVHDNTAVDPIQLSRDRVLLLVGDVGHERAVFKLIAQIVRTTNQSASYG